MAQYNAIKAAVNAYIKANGRKEITGQILNSVLNAVIDSLGRFFQFAGEALPDTDPGTPDQNVAYLAGTAGTYTHFGGLTLAPQEIALLLWNGEWAKHTMLIGIQEVVASVDDQVGTPSVDVTFANGQLSLVFHNLKGDQGDPGDAAGFGVVSADISGDVGTPGVSVETSGTNTEKNFAFHFTNLRGDPGVESVNVSIDNNTGIPSAVASVLAGVLSIDFHNLKGDPGTDGVGFASVETPTPPDGTAIITLSNGDTVTLDLNHNHDAYYSKVVGTAQPAGGFLPDVAYNLGEISGTVTFALASAVAGQLNHYFWMFSTGASAPTITFPGGITWAAGSAPTIAANKKYEISILGGVAYYSEV